MAAKLISIKTYLARFDSNLWHFHVEVPAAKVKSLVSGKDRRVICHINKTITTQAALMPLGNGDFFININQTIRKKLKLNDGDEVLIELEKDESEYGLPVPEEFEELLKQDLAGADEFEKLSAGKKRTLLYIIAKPKSADLRIRNGMAVLNHLKNCRGKLNYKELQQEIKHLS